MCVSPHKQLCQAAKATTAEYDADDDESKRYAVFDEDDDDPSGTTVLVARSEPKTPPTPGPRVFTKAPPPLAIAAPKPTRPARAAASRSPSPNALPQWYAVSSAETDAASSAAAAVAIERCRAASLSSCASSLSRLQRSGSSASLASSAGDDDDVLRREGDLMKYAVSFRVFVDARDAWRKRVPELGRLDHLRRSEIVVGQGYEALLYGLRKRPPNYPFLDLDGLEELDVFCDAIALGWALLPDCWLGLAFMLDYLADDARAKDVARMSLRARTVLAKIAECDAFPSNPLLGPTMIAGQAARVLRKAAAYAKGRRRRKSAP